MRKSKNVVHTLFFTFVLITFAGEAKATVYNVGPGQTLATIGAVPWESLNAGDTVNIFYQPTPYKEKFVLSRVGTSVAPISVHGVLGPNGERPILDGNGATTRSQLVYYSQERGVITAMCSSREITSTITGMPAAKQN